MLKRSAETLKKRYMELQAADLPKQLRNREIYEKEINAWTSMETIGCFSFLNGGIIVKTLRTFFGNLPNSG